MKFFNYYILSALFCIIAFASCEIDNFDAPNSTIEGRITDHTGQPFQVSHGASLIRMRELSWAKDDPDVYIANRTLKVQQDATYRHTKIFKGTYRMLPVGGAFYPYDDDFRQNEDDAGEIVEINSTVTKDFSVTPYLMIEWVDKPRVDADGYLICSAKFKRIQKPGYEMPNAYRANMSISKVMNATSGDGELFRNQITLNNSMEGETITFKTSRALKYYGIRYRVRISMTCQQASSASNYPGMGASNYSTIEDIDVPAR